METTIKPTKQKSKEIQGLTISDLENDINIWLTVPDTEKQPVINHLCMNADGTKVLIIYSEREPITMEHVPLS